MIKRLILLKIRNMIDINEDLLQWSINVVIKASGSSIKNENISDHQIAEKLNKPIIKKLEKRKVHSPFIDNILGADLADM